MTVTQWRKKFEEIEKKGLGDLHVICFDSSDCSTVELLEVAELVATTKENSERVSMGFEKFAEQTEILFNYMPVRFVLVS